MRSALTGKRSEPNGFTLIEIMIVMAIIVAVLLVAAPKLFNSSTAMRGSVRRIASMTREIRNNSRLYNVTTRLVITMDNEKGHSFSVESMPGNATLLTEEMQRELTRLSSSQRDEDKPKSQFDIEKRIMKSPEKLPRGLFFESVEYTSRSVPTTGGTAYIHFFPQGLAEEAAIHLTDRKTLNWTITVNPLTGAADVFERKVRLKDARSKE